MANTKMTVATYTDIAEAYDLIYDALSSIEAQALAAVNEVVDITTTGFEVDGTSDAAAALEAELALLSVYNAAYLSSQSVASSTANYLSAVRALNNLVISGQTTGTTDTEKLNNFLTECVAADWSGIGAVPYGWAALCEDAGYTITVATVS